jgi:hypothetical protein
MGVLTTDKLKFRTWRDLNHPAVTLVNMRGNASVPFIKEQLPRAQVLLVDGNADTVRSIAQGRADALVENVAFFMVFTKAYPKIQWRVLPDPIKVTYCGVGVSKGNDALRVELNRILADLHRTGFIQYAWKKWYSLPMQGSIDVDAELAREAQAPRAGSTPRQRPTSIEASNSKPAPASVPRSAAAPRVMPPSVPTRSPEPVTPPQAPARIPEPATPLDRHK